MARPEDSARVVIDERLTACGWAVQDRAEVNLGAERGVAIREFPTASGPADYALFVDRVLVGVVEAKKAGMTLTGVEEQSARYSVGLPSWVRTAGDPLPFAYETTGVETRFTSRLDPVPRSRSVFTFHRPETLAEWLAQAHGEGVLRARLQAMPPLDPAGLRDCQVEAITNLERSFAQDRPRALVQMTMGSGKTYTAVSEVYRLLKYGGARRALFLVDRANLGKQAFNEFAQYSVPGDGRKFTELYNVQRLETNRLDPVANVVITTIQRLYAMLAGKPEFEPVEEETSFFDAAFEPPREVRYNPAVPIETFDVVITDECHRSIYNQWRGVLEYFDSYLVGLTATPGTATFGFFHSNLVMEYGHDRAVADGVNVDYQVFRIRTEVTERGATVPVEEWVDRRDRRTRAVRWEQLDEELTYAPNQLDRDVVTPDQIRTVIRAYRDALPTQLFSGRTEVPKTLIFAKDDAHADDITQIVREEFGQGNDFCQKITYRATGAKPDELIANFRNSYNPRIAVTVDMIATGTDIKPLEVLLFMRSVKSRMFFEQMKGRGSRTIADTDLQAVTPDAGSKTRFVLVDAVGVCEQMKTDEPPLERKRSVAFAKLLEQVAMGARDEDTLSSLAGRLGRLATRLTAEEAQQVRTLAGGLTTRDLANRLLHALDPDAQLAAARAATGQAEPDEAALSQAAEQLADEAVRPFDSPQLRAALAGAQQRDEQTIDNVTQDTLRLAAWDGQAEDQARRVVQSFRAFIEEHRDEITALEVLYRHPRHASLRFGDIKQLAAAIQAPPLSLTTDALWRAYAQLDRDRVRGARGERVLTDLVALVRYTLERETDTATVLEPYAETISRRFADWLAEQERQRGQPFTPEQREWLTMIAGHIATSLSIAPDDFDLEPFTQRGGLGKASAVFGAELPQILAELNERLVA